MQSSKQQYWVYVILLDSAAVKRHPQKDLIDAGAKVLYVGQTAHPPGTRFHEHLRGGIFTSSVVTKYGRTLLNYEGPFATRPLAEREESRLAHSLKAKGYVIYTG